MIANRQKWNRACGTVLTGVMLFTSVPATGWAAQAAMTAPGQEQASPILKMNITREQAIDIARKVVDVAAGYTGPETSSGRSYGGRGVWEVFWRKEADPRGQIHVTVDGETGMILSLNVYDASSNRPAFPPKVDEERAVEIAKGWIEKLYPEQAGQYEPVRGEGPVIPGRGMHHLAFEKMVDGVPFVNQRIHLTIDGEGRLRDLNYQSMMPRVTFDSKEGVRSAEEVLAGIREKVNMQLVYMREGMENPSAASTRPWTLAYVPDLPTENWDAKTGQPVDWTLQPLIFSPGSEKPLAEQPQGTKPPVRERDLTEKEAVEQLMRFFPLPEGVAVERIHYEQDGYLSDHPVWRIFMEYHKEGGTIGWGGTAVDARTGEVLEVDVAPIEYERNSGQPNDANRVTRDQAREKALAFVRQHLKPYLHELYEMPYQEPPASMNEPFYRFRYERKVNGLPVRGDEVRVAVSARTGNIVEFRRSLHDVTGLPDHANVVDPDEAEALYFQGATLRLQYRLTEEPHRLMETNASQTEAKLAYTLDLPWDGATYIDARTGAAMNVFTGKPAVRKTDRQKDVPADIRGHFAEKELTYFVETGVLKPEDGKVLPEQAVSRGEFVRMLARLEGRNLEVYLHRTIERMEQVFQDVPADHPDFAVIQWAVQQGWLDRERKTFEPNRAITREEAAEILVSILGYDQVADIHEIYRLPYQDADRIRLKGHVALAVAVGLVGKENKTFQPAKPLNRAEAAILLYRLLSKRGEYAVRPLR